MISLQERTTKYQCEWQDELEQPAKGTKDANQHHGRRNCCRRFKSSEATGRVGAQRPKAKSEKARKGTRGVTKGTLSCLQGGEEGPGSQAAKGKK